MVVLQVDDSNSAYWFNFMTGEVAWARPGGDEGEEAAQTAKPGPSTTLKETEDDADLGPRERGNEDPGPPAA